MVARLSLVGCAAAPWPPPSSHPLPLRLRLYFSQSVNWRCWLQAIRQGSSDSRALLPRLLALMSFDETGSVARAIERSHSSVPLWMWLLWLPQLLTSLQRPEAFAVKPVLLSLAQKYPQVLNPKSTSTRRCGRRFIMPCLLIPFFSGSGSCPPLLHADPDSRRSPPSIHTPSLPPSLTCCGAIGHLLQRAGLGAKPAGQRGQVGVGEACRGSQGRATCSCQEAGARRGGAAAAAGRCGGRRGCSGTGGSPSSTRGHWQWCSGAPGRSNGGSSSSCSSVSSSSDCSSGSGHQCDIWSGPSPWRP